MGEPRVSVVLTTYNRARVLGETVTAILNQTYSNFELIICDDHSTDSTVEVIRGFAASDARIRYLNAEHNVGMPANLNRGIKVARGEFVANLHDGDIYDPRLLELWVAALDGCTQAGFVFNSYRDLGEWWEAGTVLSVGLRPCSAGA